MSNILLPIIPGTLPENVCFSSWQAMLNLFASYMQAQLPGETFFNYGDTKPAPELEAYPWLRTTDGRWYSFDGDWISPMNHDANERRLFVGTTGELQTYDGGDAGAPSDRSGPSWEVDTAWADRTPIGVGTVVVNPEDNAGTANHTLTEAEGAVGVHTHAYGIADLASDDAVFATSGQSNVAGYTGHYVFGGGAPLNPAETTANLFTLPSGTGGTGVPTPTAFSLIQPVRGVYVIKPTARLYYKV